MKYELKDKTLQARFCGLFDNFAERLDGSCKAVMTACPEDTWEDHCNDIIQFTAMLPNHAPFPALPCRLRFFASHIEAREESRPNAWNAYPVVLPPQPGLYLCEGETIVLKHWVRNLGEWMGQYWKLQGPDNFTVLRFREWPEFKTDD